MTQRDETRNIRIAPSILSADFSCLGNELKKIEKAGADMVHVDIMDGHFVPNITIGPVVVKYLRKATSLPLDVHLMIEHPIQFIDEFAAAGSSMITVHVETLGKSPAASLRKMRRILLRQRIRLGISLNPKTPLARITKLLEHVDFILVMSVMPGFSGQKFIPSVLPKIKKLRTMFTGDIAVDGGVNDTNAADLIRAGADILASGSYIFNAQDTRAAIERIRHAK